MALRGTPRAVGIVAVSNAFTCMMLGRVAVAARTVMSTDAVSSVSARRTADCANFVWVASVVVLMVTVFLPAAMHTARANESAP